MYVFVSPTQAGSLCVDGQVVHTTECLSSKVELKMGLWWDEVGGQATSLRSSHSTS